MHRRTTSRAKGLAVAACQFPVTADIESNGQFILSQMEIAAKRGAEIVQFPECGLGGYAGHDFRSFQDYDWRRLKNCTWKIARRAADLGVWVILGSNHRLTGRHKPHNSLYLIDPAGRIVDRYDKRFCMGKEGEEDLKHYSPGIRPVHFTVRGVVCGLLICHEWRYPEVYREYKRAGAQVIFQSWYDGGLKDTAYREKGRMLGSLIMATTRGHAACNHFWIVGTNTSRRESCFPAFAIRPDGSIHKASSRNRASVLVFQVTSEIRLEDPAKHWRFRAMAGTYHSGTPVRDARSEHRTCF
ncbi:MAG: carbon-nitrogen hydrolase family protein [Planctomycetes bacterium]|nr:carbon-nitrogen hydrolase family protein [Planctomycetota bacterium]